MASLPESIFLDTNIFIFGALDPDSDENKILSILQKDRNREQTITVIVSQELIEQILRVGKRLQNKDWASDLLARLWEQLQVDFIFVDDRDVQAISLFGDALTWLGLALLAFELAGKDSGIVLSIALTLRVTAFVILSPLARSPIAKIARRS